MTQLKLTTLAAALAFTICSTQMCIAKDLIKSYAIESQVYAQVKQAESLLASRNYAGAVELLQRAVANDPTSYSRAVHRELAQAYLGLKQYDKSVAESRKVLALDPSSPLPWYDIGTAYYSAEKYDAAVDALNKFIALTTDEADRRTARELIKQAGSFGFMRKGRIALDGEHYFEAKKWFQKAATYDPSPYSAVIHANLCYVLRELGESGAAVEEGKKALSLNGNDAQTFYSIAMAYADMTRFDEAMSWMNRYVASEADGARRQSASQALSAMRDDRDQFNNPNNKKTDYMDVMRATNSQVRWAQERLPLKVAIASGKNVQGYRPSFNNIVKTALDSWCQASGNKLDYRITNNVDDADIRIIWTREPIEITLDHPNVQATGLTNLQSGDGNATSAVVHVRTVNPFKPSEDADENETAHVILHEVGHALGIGHSKLIRDVMYFRSAPQQRSLSARDKATIARLYQNYPALGFVPKHSETASPATPVAPPAFVPPVAPDDSKVVPPMFVPPPIEDDEKLTPPMFTPVAPVDVEKVKAPLFVPSNVPAQLPSKVPAKVPTKVTPKVPSIISKPAASKVNAPLFMPPVK